MKRLAKPAEWLFWLKEQFPHLIESISDVTLVNREDVCINNSNNVGRSKPIKYVDKLALAESFNQNGFISLEEAMIVLEKPPKYTIVSQQPYEPPASFHRWEGAKLKNKDGEYICQKIDKFPAHIVRLHTNLTDHEVDTILHLIAEEENSQQSVTPNVPQTSDDIEAGLLKYMSNIRVNGRPATKKQKIEELHKELKRRVRIHKKYKKEGKVMYPIWPTYQKAREWRDKMKIKTGLVQKAQPFHTTTLANEFYDRTLVDDNIFTINGMEFDNINFTDSKLQNCISEKENELFKVLYWPKNREDRNPTDLVNIMKESMIDKIDHTKVIIFLNAKGASLMVDDEVIKDYVKDVENTLDTLQPALDEHNIQIIRGGIIPSDDRHKLNKFLEWNDYI